MPQERGTSVTSRGRLERREVERRQASGMRAAAAARFDAALVCQSLVIARCEREEEESKMRKSAERVGVVEGVPAKVVGDDERQLESVWRATHEMQ
jgi:hypothetical protein